MNEKIMKEESGERKWKFSGQKFLERSSKLSPKTNRRPTLSHPESKQETKIDISSPVHQLNASDFLPDNFFPPPITGRSCDCAEISELAEALDEREQKKARK
jgi:hypothetical protein